jgi:hypothetical protein
MFSALLDWFLHHTLFHRFDTLGSHLRGEGSLDYNGGFVRLQIHLRFNTNINCQQCCYACNRLNYVVVMKCCTCNVFFQQICMSWLCCNHTCAKMLVYLLVFHVHLIFDVFLPLMIETCELRSKSASPQFLVLIFTAHFFLTCIVSFIR